MLLLRKTLVAVGLGLALLPLATEAQVREVVSKSISVGRSDASLELEFSDGGALGISLRNGAVLIDGERVGSYEPNGALDTAWRELLAEAVTLEDGPLSEALVDWTVPAQLAGSLADAAQEIDQAIDDAITDLDVQVDTADGSVSVSINGGSLLRSLLGSARRIELLPEALSDLGDDVRVHVGEDVTVGEGEAVDGDLLVIDGDLRVDGEVDGTVVVIGGTLDLAEGGRITGDVRLADARLRARDGSVSGNVIEIEAARAEDGGERTREEIRDQVRRELRSVQRDRDGSRFMAPLRPLTRAVGGLFENLVTILALGLLGAAAVVFAGDKVEVIAEAARRSPGRAAMVGLAGTFLLLPAWVLGFVALVISIIGIPVAIAWLPLFPLAAVLAAVVGYLAVARNTGEWLADSHYPWTGWIRKSNPLITMVGGLLGLMALYVAANVLSIVPFFGFLTGLLTVAAILVTFVAAEIGFGAVLLTRVGRRREHWSAYTADEAWDAAMRAEVDEDAGGKTNDA